MSQSWWTITPTAAMTMPPHQQMADDDAGLARPRALEPAAPQRRGRPEEDEEQRVHPAEIGDAPVAGRS